MRNRRFIALGLSSLLAYAAFQTGCTPTGTGNGSDGGMGSVRLLITDKPFPFDMIEEALVTITRVEVRRAASSDCAESCSDELFCNGTESCDGGACEPGTPPCAEGTLCDEEADVCTTLDGQPLPPDDDSEDDESENDGNDNDSDDSDDDESDDDADGPFLVIFEGEQQFDLLQLQNGQTDLLTDAQIPAGTYNQMRLIVTEGQITLKEDGRVFPLRVPSGEQTGIKLHFEFEVIDGEETQLLLDVDLSRAFSPIPGGRINTSSEIRGFRFSPSVAMRLINLRDAGRITGTVTTEGDGGLTPVAGASVTAYLGDEEVTSTSTQLDGIYVLGGLPTGEYRVTVSATGYDDVEQMGVVVSAGEETTGVDFTLTAAEAVDAVTDPELEPAPETSQE